eukprot:9287323-Alexandrium_andersonii.AAC.1
MKHRRTRHVERLLVGRSHGFHASWPGGAPGRGGVPGPGPPEHQPQPRGDPGGHPGHGAPHPQCARPALCGDASGSSC